MWHLGHGQQTGTKTYEHCYTVDRLHTDRCDTFTPSSILVLILPISHLILMGNSPPLPSHLFPVVFLQGSTLGPILFSMYVAPLERLVDECCARCHQYADNTQLYMRLISGSDTLVDFSLCANSRYIMVSCQWSYARSKEDRGDCLWHC